GAQRSGAVAPSPGAGTGDARVRYLPGQRRRSAIAGDRSIALVTVGSPLRDLYAEHFPLLYRWMGSREGGFAAAGPRASDIGAVEWVNACRAGDYVGRFVWTLPRHAFRIALVGSDGRVEAERAG